MLQQMRENKLPQTLHVCIAWDTVLIGLNLTKRHFRWSNKLFVDTSILIRQGVCNQNFLSLVYTGWPAGPTFPYFLIQSPTFPYFLTKQPYYPYFLGCHIVKLNKEHLKHVFYTDFQH